MIGCAAFYGDEPQMQLCGGERCCCSQCLLVEGRRRSAQQNDPRFDRKHHGPAAVGVFVAVWAVGSLTLPGRLSISSSAAGAVGGAGGFSKQKRHLYRVNSANRQQSFSNLG